MAESLEIHTLQAWKTITSYEADDICSHYPDGIKRIRDDSGIEHRIINMPAIMGVNEIDIAQYPTDKGQTTRMSLKLNVGKMIGGSSIAMTKLRKKTAEKFIKAVSRMLDDKLHLHKKNRDALDWKFKRIDVGGDYHIGTSREEELQFHVRQLHKTYFPYNNKNYSMTRWNQALYDPYPEKKNESVRISNTSSTYNIYAKAPEYRMKHPDRTLSAKEHQDSDDVIRVEKQMEGQALKAFGSTKFSALADESKTFKIKEQTINDIVEIFGTGDYVSLYEGRKIIEDSELSDADKIRMTFLRLQVCNLGYEGTLQWFVKNKGMTEKTSIEYLRKYRKKTESLGISMIALTDEDIAIMGKNRIKSLGKIMQEQHCQSKERKSRSSFGTYWYEEKNKRYKYNISLHRPDGTKKRSTVPGKKDESLEDVEIKVGQRIVDNMNANMRSCGKDLVARLRCLEYAKIELTAYRTVVESDKVIQRIDRMMKVLEKKKDFVKGGE